MAKLKSLDFVPKIVVIIVMSNLVVVVAHIYTLKGRALSNHVSHT